MKAFSRCRNTLGLAFALSIGLLSSIGIVLSRAQTNAQQSPALPPWQVRVVGPRMLNPKSDKPDLSTLAERVIENQLPRHLPIKVEIKGLDVEPLLRNLEVKVTNTSNKPIYYLELDISLPGVLSKDGYDIVFPLQYGRTELIDFDEPVRPGDAPLQPGESHVFKVPKENLEPFERYASSINLAQSEIRTVYLFFQQINFGDKTGYVGTGGTRIPNIRQGRPRVALVGGGGKKAKPA
jgi:hypothetical protein